MLRNIQKMGGRIFKGIKERADELELKELYNQQDQKTKIAASISAVGIVLFLAVAILFPFRARLFSLIFQKPFSLAAPTLGNGDVNNDGSVNGSDVKLAMQSWGTGVTGTLDQYQDGKENSFDFANIVNNYPVTPTPTPISSSGEWTQFGHDAQHTNYTAQSVATPWQYKWQWNGADANGQPQSGHISIPNLVQPITGNGLVYVVATGGVYALNQTNGSVAWSNTSLGTLSATAAYNSGYVYVASGNNNLYKLNASNGSIAGTFNAGSALNLAPTIVGSTIYVVAANGNLIAVNTSTMQSTWTYSGGSNGVTPAAYSPSRNVLVYVTQDLYVHAVNVADGSRKWRVKPTSRAYTTADPSSNLTEAVNGWPVIADQHGLVFVRYRLEWQTLWNGPGTGGAFPTTNSAIRTFLQSNPTQQPLFPLSLDTGAQAFIANVGNGGAGDGGTLPMGPQPVVANMGGQEVAYVVFRNALACGDPAGSGAPGGSGYCDGREDSTLGEMELDNTTASGYQAGDVRFVSFSNWANGTLIIRTDEQMQLTMIGNSVFHNHWLSSQGATITDRSAAYGSTLSNPIRTTYPPYVIWRQVYCPTTNTQCNPQIYPGGSGTTYGPSDCPFNGTTRYCSQELYSYGDSRSYPPGFYEYWNSNNGGSTPYIIASAGLVLVKTGDGGIIALQNGNPLGQAPAQQNLAQSSTAQVLGTSLAPLDLSTVPVISYQDAPKYEGRYATVVGTIASAVNHLPKAIYLGFTDSHDGALLVRVFNQDLPKFSYDPMTLKGKKVRITGFVTLYWPEGKDPEIIVTDPSQIKIE
ncbi:PQQ-binding-like beta-propeller repeat protein [Patescibacteria group bacterium]|nr:PQQ-binding-like beta-propeller repeat protein [Patescibacteria group bacterium]